MIALGHTLRQSPWRGLLLCSALAVLPAAALGQSVDYGTLEQVFGEPITTSATGKPQRASDVPADMVIITQDDIRRSGATSIPDVLQFVTGIDIRRYSFGDTQVGIRGYNTPLNPRLLVLVDGRQVYDDSFGFVAWSSIPVQLGEIRQIEIVKGPNSALFGFNAASGVINIVTFDPLLDNTNEITVRGGTQHYGQGEAVATQHIGTTAGVRVSVGGWRATDFRERPSVAAPAPGYGSFNADGRWQATPSLLLRASAGYTDSHSLFGVPFTNITEGAFHRSYVRLGAAADTRAGTVDADVYRNQALDIGVGTDQKVMTTVAKLSDLVKLDASNTVRLGFEYRNTSIYSIPSIYSGTISYDNYAANAMWNWQISPVMELTNAVRLDHLVLHQSGPLLVTPGRTAQIYNNSTLTVPSFNSGLVIHVTDADTVRLTAARGLQLPSLVDFGAQDPIGPGAYSLGSPRLRPDAVWNADVAYVRSLASLGASLETSVFFQRHTDLLGGSTPLAPAGDIFAITQENIGSSNEIGVEVGLRGKTEGGYRWNASYRYASLTQRIPADVAAAPASRPANGTPLHEVIVGAGYTSGPWEMDIAGRFQSGFTDYEVNALGVSVPVRVPDYVTLNARIGYQLTDHVTLAATAQQFNATRLLQAAGSYIDRRFILSATLHY